MKSAGRERRTGWWAIVAIALVLAAGCRDGATSSATGTTTSTELPSTTTTPATTAVSTSSPTTPSTLLPLDQDPPVIDLAYAQRVLDAIDKLEGDVSRILYREKTMTADVEGMLTSYLFGDALDGARKGLANDMSVGFRSYRDPPSDPRLLGRQVVSSRPGCIAMLADSDFGPRYRTPVDVQRNIAIVLQRNRKPTAQEHQFNPTNWLETAGGTLAPGKTLTEVCK